MMLGEQVPSRGYCGWKTLLLLSLLLGLAAFLSWPQALDSEDPAVDAVAVPYVQAAAATLHQLPRFMQSRPAWPFAPQQKTSAFSGQISRSASGVSANALPNPPSLASPSRVSQSEIRQFLNSNPPGKCLYADQHASLCGNLVVLRPSTALQAEAGEKTSTLDADGIIKDLTERWDKVEDKTTAGLYAGGALVALIFANNILSTVNSIPLLPKLFEIVGLGYTGWFTYRYLLFKSSREELIQDIEELKKKVSGDQ